MGHDHNQQSLAVEYDVNMGLLTVLTGYIGVINRGYNH